MAPNLNSARHVIEAELSHARQGAAYYAARAEALEVPLDQLERVDNQPQPPSESTKKAAPSGTTGRRTARRAANSKRALQRASVNGSSRQPNKTSQGMKRRSAGSSTDTSALPTTGGDFWFKLVSEQPQSAIDIANTAIKELGIGPDQKEQIQKLKQRVSPALASLVATQKIRDSGTGRDRHYFKTADEQGRLRKNAFLKS